MGMLLTPGSTLFFSAPKAAIASATAADSTHFLCSGLGGHICSFLFLNILGMTAKTGFTSGLLPYVYHLIIEV